MAELLYVRGLAFCAGRIEAEGYITEAQIKVFAMKLTGNVSKHAEQLVRHQLWIKVDGGYQVRSWLKWNASAQEIDRVKAGDRERKKKVNSIQHPIANEHASGRNPTEGTPDSLTVSSSVQSRSVKAPNPPAWPDGRLRPPSNPRATGTNPRGPKLDALDAWAQASEREPS